MKVNIPSIFESAVAQVITTHAEIGGDFPRIRTWRSIDKEGRWSPDTDYALPVIFVTATTPEPDAQDQRQVTVVVGALTNAADDKSHQQIADYEAALQDVMDQLEAQYCSSGPYWQTFTQRITEEMAVADFAVHVGGVEAGPGVEPSLDEGMNVISMSLVIHYSRSDR
jgi:hypothetical protein